MISPKSNDKKVVDDNNSGSKKEEETIIENLGPNDNENSTVVKQRHGCVTAWLIYLMIGSSIGAIGYIYMFLFDQPNGISYPIIVLLGIMCIVNVVSSVLVFQWKKIGFWGFIFTSISGLIINLSIGLGIVTSLLGLVGIAILYGVLQIKKKNVTTWESLE